MSVIDQEESPSNPAVAILAAVLILLVVFIATKEPQTRSIESDRNKVLLRD